MKLLRQLLAEMDELNCQECGEFLRTKKDFETGVCEACRHDAEENAKAKEEDCQFMA